MKTILLDCDGVLADFTGACLDVVHGFTERRWERAEITKWDLFDLFTCPVKGDLKNRVRDAVGKKGFCEKMRPCPGAQAGVKALEAMGRVLVVTSPWHSPTWCSERYTWLERWFGIASDRVIFAKDKSPVRGDVFVDDNVENVVRWAKAGRGTGVVWTQPHNARDVLPYIITRAPEGDWDRIAYLARWGAS